MLVLSRKLDQDILIGDNIRIRVLKVKGNTIRLGVEAPRDVKVVRGELPPINHGNAVTAKEDEQRACEPKTVQAQDAEITIVFSNQNSKARNARHPAENVITGGANSSQQHVLPFQRSEKSDDRIAQSNRQNPQVTSDETVRFRAPLPMSLHHNRLKELVKELTQGNRS